MIETINIERSIPKEQFHCSQTELLKLSRLNIFIGQNNSGKSRLIRSLFNNDLHIKDSTKVVQQITESIDTFNAFYDELLTKYKIVKWNNQHPPDFWKMPPFEYLVENNTNVFSDLDKLIGDRENLDFGASVNFGDQGMRHWAGKITQDFRIAAGEIKKVRSKFKLDLKHYTHHRMYIPVLRGLRPIQGHKEPYISRTRSDYFPNLVDQNRQEIFTGLDLYEKLRKLLLGSNPERQKVKDFEQFLSESFFQNKEVSIVPRDGRDVVFVSIDGEERPIFELGDGIQSIIILTYPLFFNSDQERLVFIEEPEHFLHPGMQRLLISTLLKPKFSKFQYFITTHSNHFLELMQEYDNISLYRVSRIHKKKISEVDHLLSPDSSLLDLIGVNNASVLVSNCTIWVEGITDRLYLRKYLEVYLKEKKPASTLKEDFNYAFVEYSGSNITHWSFDEENSEEAITAKKIANRIFLVADADFDATGEIPDFKKKRFEKLKKSLDKNFYRLPCREIENTLTKEIIEKVICHKEGIELSDLKSKPGVSNTFEKSNIGEWIEKKYKDLKRKYKNESTLYDKVNFAHLAISEINEITDLSPSAIHLCEQAVAFIEAHNSKNNS
ncbi:MAG: ATP-binding protein [Crocinitomicaceae bacterium]|nr:ATP-binding protein [Crocinitomicaceae bacterium]